VTRDAPDTAPDADPAAATHTAAAALGARRSEAAELLAGRLAAGLAAPGVPALVALGLRAEAPGAGAGLAADSADADDADSDAGGGVSVDECREIVRIAVEHRPW
jgi:hypothetical protein